MPVTSVGSGGRYTYDENGAGLCEPESSEPRGSDADHDLDCELKAGKAAAACGLAAGTIVSGAPTLIGSVVAAFLLGAACALEVEDAYVCYDEE